LDFSLKTGFEGRKRAFHNQTAGFVPPPDFPYPAPPGLFGLSSLPPVPHPPLDWFFFSTPLCPVPVPHLFRIYHHPRMPFYRSVMQHFPASPSLYTFAFGFFPTRFVLLPFVAPHLFLLSGPPGPRYPPPTIVGLRPFGQPGGGAPFFAWLSKFLKWCWVSLST